MATINIPDDRWQEMVDTYERDGLCVMDGHLEGGVPVVIAYGLTLDDLVTKIAGILARDREKRSVENAARSVQQSLSVIPVVLDSSNPMN